MSATPYGYGYVLWRQNTHVFNCYRTPKDADPFGFGDLPIKRCVFLSLPKWSNHWVTKGTTDPNVAGVARILVIL